MTQKDRREFLIRALLREQPQYADAEIPTDGEGQKTVLRSLMNVRMPRPASAPFLTVQDAYLREAIRAKGVTALRDLVPVQGDLYLWRGDITTLACDAVVNAANSQMLGCFCPCHGCIDNAIHTYAGVQLRLECAEIMKAQGGEEKTGGAKITSAYNLPCKYVIHTVGPVVRDEPTARNCDDLASCYRSCLELAEKNKIRSLAFCCISTGEFHFPNRRAAEIAIRTVKEYKTGTNSPMKVIFNVFKQADYAIYRELLGGSEDSL